MPNVSFTMLNSMAHRDFETALDRHADWGLKHLDLKGGILGEDVGSLSSEQATQAKDMIESRGLSVYCMSTTLFDEFVEVGEDAFVVNHLDLVDRAIENAKRWIFKIGRQPVGFNDCLRRTQDQVCISSCEAERCDTRGSLFAFWPLAGFADHLDRHPRPRDVGRGLVELDLCRNHSMMNREDCLD